VGALDVSHFAGREVEVAELSAWIVPERCRLVTLVGMGGIGKSMLGWYVAVAAVGTAAYVYRELFFRFFSRRWQYDYSVKAINRLDPRALEVMLAPTARLLPFVAGQFVFVHFGGSAEWERHPFTVSSAPQERDLRLSIEALGDYTQHLSDTLQPGAPAIVSIAFGLFDYRQGTREQVWIAGGIGITPFRSWIRAFPTEQ